jgi:hypothetical protein
VTGGLLILAGLLLATRTGRRAKTPAAANAQNTTGDNDA